MSFVIKNRGNNTIICHVSEVADALVADSQFRVDGTDFLSILELAKARCEDSPEYNMLPEKEDQYVMYTTKAGKKIMCQVVRLFNPDSEGYPCHLELVHLQHIDGSFCAEASRCKAIDLSAMNPALANALIQGPELCEQDNVGNAPTLKHGLRK